MDEAATWCGACGWDLHDEVLLLEPDSGDRLAPAVVDVGGHGGSRRRRRRDLLAVVAAITGGLILLAALGANGGAEHPASEGADRTTKTTRRAAPLTTTVTLPPTTVPTTTVPPGPLLSVPTGVTLVAMNSDGVVVIDVDSGAITTLNGFRPPDSLIPVHEPDGYVSLSPGSIATFRTLGVGPELPLGRATWVMEAAAPDRVWLVLDDADQRHPVAVTLMDHAGAVVMGPINVPRTATIIGGSEAGLLVTAVGRVFVLGDASSESVAEGRALAADADQVATFFCDDRLECGIDVTNLRTRRVLHVVIPPDVSAFEWTAARFSPDGSTLAVWMEGPFGLGLYLVDMASGLASPVPDAIARNGPNGPQAMAWSPAGDWLFWTDGPAHAYHPGDPSSWELPLPEQDYWAVAAFDTRSET